MGKYVALLRGVNVGGKNTISMAELKVCCEAAGLVNVRTYINSGNVLFESEQKDTSRLTAMLEKCIGEQFSNYTPRVLVCSHEQLRGIVEGAPKGFGGQPDKYRYDVFFLLPPLTAAEALQCISLREGVDQVAAGEGALYFWRLTAQITKSRINKIIGTPDYQNMTIRNWNTTTKLLKLLES